MKYLFINYAHPKVKHISGVRRYFFAKSLCKKGHKVILLTQNLTSEEGNKNLESLKNEFINHDWRNPFIVSFKLVSVKGLNLKRNKNISSAFRKLLTLYLIIFHKGQIPDFTYGAKYYYPFFKNTFRPDYIWATGESNITQIAKELSEILNIPYFLDIKDPWDNIPFPFRFFLARNFRDANGVTYNSAFQLKVSGKYFKNLPAKIIYSGIPLKLVNSIQPVNEENNFSITLLGSIDQLDKLQFFIEGLILFAKKLKSCQTNIQLQFNYLGGAYQLIQENLRQLGDYYTISLKKYIPLKQMLKICKSSNINCYIWNEDTFHHKLLELLACQKPIIAFPGEKEESMILAKKCGDYFFRPKNLTELIDTFNYVYNNEYFEASNEEIFQAFTWDAQSLELISFLTD